MKTSERFTTALLSRVGLAVSIRSRRSSRAAVDPHLAARSNQHLPGEHHTFVGSDAFRHDDLIALTLSQLDGPKFGGVVRLHHVNERPLLADLRGLIGNQHGCFFRG